MSELRGRPAGFGPRLPVQGRQATRASVGCRSDRRRHRWIAVLAVLALTGALSSCADSGRTATDGVGDATPQPAVSESITAPSVGERAEESPPTEPTSEAVASGEIWQWALGRNIWADQRLAELASTVSPASDTISMQPDGFSLQLDTSGTVAAVLLYNDEVALGLPVSETSFRAYPTALPAGLSWTDTYDTVMARYGEGRLVTGGWGVTYTFAYQTQDGTGLDLTFLAAHADDLPGAPLHIVTVRAATG